MKIVVAGSNPLGFSLASGLAKAKYDVRVLEEDAEKGKDGRIKNDAADISTAADFKKRIVPSCSIKEISGADAFFICTPSYTTEGIMTRIKDSLTERTLVISIQNGIGNLQTISEYIEPSRVIGAVSNYDFFSSETRKIKQGRADKILLGLESGRVLGIVRDIGSILGKARIPAKITKDINSAIWSKLVIDAAINPVSAITRLRNGALPQTEYTKEIMQRVVSEAVKVAKRKKVKLAYEDPIQKVETVCRSSPDSVSSMLADILAKRKTEIEHINGAIVRHAKSLNIKTPTNEMLTDIIKGMESNYPAVIT